MKEVEHGSSQVGAVLSDLREIREGSFGNYDLDRNQVDEGAWPEGSFIGAGRLQRLGSVDQTSP
jgi:hypothetical protein